MFFMVIEHFRDGDTRPVRRCLRDAGRWMPDGVAHVGSWVEPDRKRCFGVLECG